MKNIKLDITVPEEILLTLREENFQLAIDMKKFAAIKLFQDKKLSIGQSALLADMTEEDFIKYLGSNGISIFSFKNAGDLSEDLKNA